MNKIIKLWPYFIILLSLLGATILIIWLDYETKTWNDVFSRQNLLNAIVFYFMPSFIVVSFIYSQLNRVLNKSKVLSIAISIFIGTPISFISVILLLQLVKIIGTA
jgi:hypothetical protein